jgi:hypothetical protein
MRCYVSQPLGDHVSPVTADDVQRGAKQAEEAHAVQFGVVLAVALELFA